jgi:hypothetical protein
VEYVPYYLTTISVIVSALPNGELSTSEQTVTAPPAPPLPTLTWEFEGLVLTYPTTYVAYTSFEHISVSTNVFAQTCASATAPLTLGNPTPWASLVFPTSDVLPGLHLPTALVNYLDSNPTVISELGGTIASNCDPQQSGTATPAAAPTGTTTVASAVGTLSLRATSTVSAEAVSQPAASANPPATSANPPATAANPPPTVVNTPATSAAATPVTSPVAPGGTTPVPPNSIATTQSVPSPPTTTPATQSSNQATLNRVSVSSSYLMYIGGLVMLNLWL